VPLRLTPLYSYHAAHAKLTEFAGYLMPLYYESILAEHMAVRERCGLFDVSHMARFLIEGPDAASFLDGLVPSDLSSLQPGRAAYTLLLNEAAGILDDVIIMRLEEERYLLVGNAVNREKDASWLRARRGAARVSVADITEASAMVALQGPLAAGLLAQLFPSAPGLRRFGLLQARFEGQVAIISRTGYTGEDGFEVVLLDVMLHRPDPALALWQRLLELGARPCGLGARDSLRLEAGYCLYGQDINEDTNPLEAGLERLVNLEKGEFVGRAALSSAKIREKRVGLLLLEPGVPRAGQQLARDSAIVGRITSGGYSPILRRGIALGYVAPELAQENLELLVVAEGRSRRALIRRPPFYDQSLYGYRRGARERGQAWSAS